MTLAFSAALVPAGPAAAGESAVAVKAAFLKNFVRFVTWPPERFADAAAPFRLCVVNDDALIAELARVAGTATVDAHLLHVEARVRGESVDDCHLLFIGGNDTVLTEKLLASTAAASVLTVQDSSQPIPSGVIRFFLEGDRLRFEINQADAERRHLQLSAKLLSLARVTRL